MAKIIFQSITAAQCALVMRNMRPEVQQCRMTGSAHLQPSQQQVVTSLTTFFAKCSNNLAAKKPKFY